MVWQLSGPSSATADGPYASHGSGRALIRASNNGLSALISAKGKLLTVAPQFQPDTVRGSVVPMSGVTPFVRLGNLPILLLSVLVIAGSFLKRFRYRTV